MRQTQRKYLYALLLSLCVLGSIKASASHFYGADFYYTWVSGNTYTITLAVYGDCAGTSFSTLNGSTPEVEIWNGSTLANTIYLSQVGPGVEVTPVCPAQASNTICASTSGTIPGVKRYIYSATYNLGGTSANWLFRFTSDMGSMAVSGRSNTISNINPGSFTVLEARLNNQNAPNSSVNYTTIPTPFFCINKAGNYNPGAVDPNLDSLNFSLVSGLHTSGTVSYISPYTATAPLAVSTGTYSFSAVNGQMAFTPNATQRSLVVSQVAEYRNNVLVGTSMREMTFVVLSTCSNNPPGGSVSNLSQGLRSSNSTSVVACKALGSISFNINPTDIDTNRISMQVSGLPSGAALTVTGNNGLAPTGAFSWNIASVAPGTYTFFITFTDDGCPLASRQSVAYTIIVHGQPSLTYSLLSPATCAAKARFTLTPSGGSAPYTISITGGVVADTFRNVSGAVTDSVGPGMYRMAVRNTGGCTFDTLITIASPSSLNLNGAATGTTCVGDSTGSISVTVTGGTPPYTFALGSGAFSATSVFSGLSAGSYSVQVRDSGGCSQSASFTVGSPAQIAATVALARPTCSARSDGSITLSGFNSVGPYTYAIGSGIFASSGSFSGLPAGQYTVHIRNSLGCTIDTLITLRDSITVTAALTAVNPLCHGTTSGSVTVSASGSSLPYSYAINSGTFGGSPVFGNLPSGTYTIHVRDAALCFFDTAVTLHDPPRLTVAPTGVTPISCFGGSNGAAGITAAGGTPGYTYAIGSGPYGAAPGFTGLSAGRYVLHARDSNGCIADTAVQILQPPVLRMALQVSKLRCNGDSNGSVTVIASGGTPGYAYAAGGAAFGPSAVLSGLPAGAHIIHLKDANGCTRDSVVTLGQPAPLLIGYTATQPLCFATATGTATISGTGGTLPYTYAINGGSFGTAPLFTGVPAGTHTLRLQDSAGCRKDTIIVLGQPSPIVSGAVIRKTRCMPLSTGQIMLNPSGGSPGYTYAINADPYQNAALFDSLKADNYIIHIKDVRGCTLDTAIRILDSLFIHSTYTVTDALCYDSSDGAVTIAPSGGDSPYTYAVNSAAFSTANPVTGLAAGSHTLHIRDAHGCRLDTALIIGQPTRVVPAVVISQPLCFGAANGQLSIAGSGGMPGYTFAVGTGAFASTNNIVSKLAAGTYLVSVRDANGCIRDTTVLMGQPDKMAIDSLIVTHAKCFGSNTGTITVFNHGGTAPYTYARNNNPYTPSNLLSGYYAGTGFVHIKDARGCLLDSAVRIKEPAPLYFQKPAIKEPTCEGFKDGAISISGTGSVPPYSYMLSGQAYTPSGIFSGLPAGTHAIRIKDSNGCYRDTTVVLTGYPPIGISGTEVIPPGCYDFRNGRVRIPVTGGTAPFTWKLVAPALTNTTGIFDSLRKGSYAFIITDAKGCRKDTTLYLDQPPLLHATASATTNDCEGPNNSGEVTTQVEGGTPPYTYAWSHGSTAESLSGLGNGSYVVTVTDANGCTDTARALVEYDCCSPFIPDAFTPNGDGRNDKFRMFWKGNVTKLQLFVYNRYGERVFVSYRPDLGWDGTWHGKPCDVGVYFYMLKYVCGNGGDNYIEHKGDVTLIR